MSPLIYRAHSHLFYVLLIYLALDSHKGSELSSFSSHADQISFSNFSIYACAGSRERAPASQYNCPPISHDRVQSRGFQSHDQRVTCSFLAFLNHDFFLTQSLADGGSAVGEMFKFTFDSGNSIFNPFAAKAEEEERIQQSTAPQVIARKLPAPPKRPLLPPLVPDEVQPSRKRGWAPTTSSASAPTSQPTFTNGWIDTPSRYLEAALQSHKGEGENEDDMIGGELTIMAIFYIRDNPFSDCGVRTTTQCPSLNVPLSLLTTTMSDLPAAKRRKTLTGTIISTAFSAALIGTAVGMTAYRMYDPF